jgi:glycogen synthase
MRILHVLDHSLPLHSGYTFRTRSILRAQQARGWTVLGLTTPRHSEKDARDQTIDGIDFRRTPGGTPSGVLGLFAEMAATTKALEATAREWKPDIIHAHSPALNGIPALRVGKKLNIPVVYEVRAFWEDAAVDHGTTAEGSLRYRLTRMQETFVLKRAQAVTTICEGLRQDIVARGVPAAQVTVIPNAVDAQSFVPRQAAEPALQEKLGLVGNKVMGFLGSYYAYEGLDLLLEALPLVLKQEPNARILLVGGGPQEGNLKAQAKKLGIEDNVIFVGRVPHSEVNRYYDLIDVLVYPRHSMRLTELVTPLKPLEAMAQKHLLLASDVGGHKELIEHGKTGFLFKAGDAQALADATILLLGAPGAHETIRTAGRAYVDQVRNWTNSVSNYEAIYGTLMRKVAK